MLSLPRPIHFLAISPIAITNLLYPLAGEQVLSSREMSLANRQEVGWVNQIFAENILLNLAYLRGTHSGKKVNWDEIKKPFEYQFTLEPNQTFAYHEDILPKYQAKTAKTTNTHFNATEGFKTDGYLFGDGVCHLASLIYWVVKEAGLEAEAPTNHNFMPIPDIPKEYGVSIYSNPYSKDSNSQQNLYITNNKDKPITFKFEYKDDKVKVSIITN